MKKRLYFDTSASIKEFAPEVGSELIDKLTTRAREGHIQIVSSVWVINEALAIIDRKFRKKELKQNDVQTIIATYVERMTSSSETSSFLFAPIDHIIVTESRSLIDTIHISPDDALHIYTGWVFDCEYFLVHDNKIVKRLKSFRYDGMKVIDLGSKQDRDYLEHQLEL